MSSRHFSTSAAGMVSGLPDERFELSVHLRRSEKLLEVKEASLILETAEASARGEMPEFPGLRGERIGARYATRRSLVTAARLALHPLHPERVTALLQEYMLRREAHSFYQHHWIHDDDEVVRGGDGVRGLNIRVPTSEVSDYWTPECAIRWFETRQSREVADRQDGGATRQATVRNEEGGPDSAGE